jgi:hypothetical protein
LVRELAIEEGVVNRLRIGQKDNSERSILKLRRSPYPPVGLDLFSERSIDCLTSLISP